MNKDVIQSLAWAGGILALALAASLARQQGFIGDEMTTRIVIVAIGLMIVWQGNRIPKTFVPDARARQAKRVAGWSLALSGLVYTGMFAFAPIWLAVILGCGAIMIGMAVTFGYCLSLRDKTNVA